MSSARRVRTFTVRSTQQHDPRRGDLVRDEYRGDRMPLTPAEVHNVAFKKPPIGKRGYDEEEVDAFLDIVEVELSRLIEENNELRNRAGSGQPASATAAAPSDGAE